MCFMLQFCKLFKSLSCKKRPRTTPSLKEENDEALQQRRLRQLYLRRLYLTPAEAAKERTAKLQELYFHAENACRQEFLNSVKEEEEKEENKKEALPITVSETDSLAIEQEENTDASAREKELAQDIECKFYEDKKEKDAPLGCPLDVNNDKHQSHKKACRKFVAKRQQLKQEQVVKIRASYKQEARLQVLKKTGKKNNYKLAHEYQKIKPEKITITIRKTAKKRKKEKQGSAIIKQLLNGNEELRKAKKKEITDRAIEKKRLLADINNLKEINRMEIAEREKINNENKRLLEAFGVLKKENNDMKAKHQEEELSMQIKVNQLQVEDQIVKQDKGRGDGEVASAQNYMTDYIIKEDAIKGGVGEIKTGDGRSKKRRARRRNQQLAASGMR